MTRFTLWLSAGGNSVQPCGDPVSHHLFMRCLFHAKHDSNLKFDVKTINVNKKSYDFNETGLRKVPGIHTEDDETFETEDDILDFLESLPPKRPDDVEAEDSTCDLFIKFAWFLKDVDHNEKALNTELLRLEKYLTKTGLRFLCSNEVTHIDCLVLTRLHSIRIAAKALKNYTFPVELAKVREYMKNGYDEEIFRLSCPSDQEIILHWSERKDAPSLSSKEKARLVREQPTYSFIIDA
ncbi:unnamed protein product [Caenorhabditis bovis]|uniref:GST C-terminal domain-containing protein n=1 Tax=Caenorhabditis bovis TaxID=2654633 RepID=A0A8S1EXY1_9PELO|nr:unnamed protein product [Caenorhabditis bovis]